MSPKHTPGPWEWWTSNSFRRLSGPDGRDGGVLHAVVHRDGVADVQASDADRNLIAAAPELLEACKLAEHFLASLNGRVSEEVWRDGYEASKALATAVHKARGKP